MSEHDTKLEALGFGVKVTCLDAGTYKTPSKWHVTLTFNGRDVRKSPYLSGCGNRRIKINATWGFDPCRANGKPLFVRGERVPFRMKWTMREMEMLAQFSEPIPPTLADVLSSLILDGDAWANAHNIDDFASELGFEKMSKAIKAYAECGKTYKALQMIPREAMDAAREVLANY